ncbi:hypothetical protein BV898_00780 [Hypsibius exemplaris]|uniref:Cytochrome b-c1 complex subunit 7 n=1 Tax=Hypsibius exemplaris TaxID=2072580 RepID=A0A1W0XC47_HYPEX|nr:hypothetical protein BV898_00780 [Hypsibius exemplaris]
MSTNIVFATRTPAAQMVQNYGFIKKAFDKWFYGVQEYNRFGLYKSDLYRDGHEDVAEAVRRLPDDLYTGRIHRCHRAIQVSHSGIDNTDHTSDVTKSRRSTDRVTHLLSAHHRPAPVASTRATQRRRHDSISAHNA